jgi:Cupin domain
VDFQPHAVAPLHQHPEEQIGTMPEGECEFELNCVKRTIRPGDVYVIPPNVPHSARAYDSPAWPWTPSRARASAQALSAFAAGAALYKGDYLAEDIGAGWTANASRSQHAVISRY